MKNLSRGLLAAAIALALSAAPAAADRTATIRVEGQTTTLLPRTAVTVPDGGAIPGADSSCQWNEPAGALERGTNGNWDRQAFVQTIMGETQSGTRGWFYVVNRKWGGGFCFEELVPGAEIVVYAGEYDANYNPKELLPFLRDVPSRAQTGVPFTVTVEESVPDRDPQYGGYVPGTGTTRPASGVTVTAGDAVATTDAEGRATLVVARPGDVTVQARRGTGAARSEQVPLCVTTGDDGRCGTTTPRPAAAPACESSGRDGRCGSPDKEPPKTLIDTIREQQRFARGRAPRVVRGRSGVARRSDFRRSGLEPDPSGIAAVELRLTRTDRGRCSAFDVRRERFVKRTICGARGGYAKVAAQPEWEYQLPFSLPRGRYVLDVRSGDRQGNKDFERRRRENRVVFVVR